MRDAFFKGFSEEMEKIGVKGPSLSRTFKRLGLSPAARKDQASILKRIRRQDPKGRGRGRGSRSHMKLEGERRWLASFKP